MTMKTGRFIKALVTPTKILSATEFLCWRSDKESSFSVKSQAKQHQIDGGMNIFICRFGLVYSPGYMDCGSMGWVPARGLVGSKFC